LVFQHTAVRYAQQECKNNTFQDFFEKDGIAQRMRKQLRLRQVLLELIKELEESISSDLIDNPSFQMQEIVPWEIT
jgi:hypothetical protein